MQRRQTALGSTHTAADGSGSAESTDTAAGSPLNHAGVHAQKISACFGAEHIGVRDVEVIARNRDIELFSSARAMASFIESMSLPFCSNWSMRGVLVRFGVETVLPAWGAIGLGKWERGLAYSTRNGCAGADAGLLAEGACGIDADWGSCAQAPAPRVVAIANIAKNLEDVQTRQ